MSLPSRTTYRDIHADTPLPVITSALVQCYLDGFAVSSLSDKAKELYNNRYLHFVKWTQFNSMICINAICCAEMRREITYDIDVTMDTDGVINECQCSVWSRNGPRSTLQACASCVMGSHKIQ